MHDRSKDARRAARGPVDMERGIGDPPCTPLGKPVVSRHDSLSRRILEDWRFHGYEAHLPSSAYRLQTLYLDFGQIAPAEHLAALLLRALDAPLAGGEDSAEREARGDLRGEEGTRMRERVARLSRRAMVTALVFNAHFWNVRLALDVVGGGEPLEPAALGTCAYVAERRTGQGLSGDLRYYAPFGERLEAFCSGHCLPAVRPLPSEDLPCEPPRTPVSCGMLKILEGFRFFASFPDE